MTVDQIVADVLMLVVALMDRFEELMDEAPDEATRKKFEKLMMEMR